MSREVGDKIGPRIADLAARAVVAVLRDHAPLAAKIRQVANQALIDRAGREIGDHLRPFIDKAIAADPNMPDHVRDYLQRTASGKHQWQAIAGAISLSGAGSALSEIISNYIAPGVYEAVAVSPHLKPDIGTIAQLVARGIRANVDGESDAAELGYNATYWSELVQAALTIPDAVTLGDAVNRGLLPDFELDNALQHAGVPPTYAAAVRELRHQLLSPADAALAEVKGVLAEAEAAAIAAKNGVGAADFATLLGITGEPPAPEQLGQALRRGFIDDARFAHGIRQSRLRNEWLDVLLKLRFAPMSTADAVDAAVQGHLPEAEALAKAVQNGLEPGDFPALLATAGEPLSRTEMEQLYNRGLVGEAAVKQAIRESRVKNKYINDAFALHERLPEGRQVVSMITHGAVTKPQGLRLLMQLGYSEQVAGYLVAEGTNAKIGAHKDLTVGEIRQLYTAGVFTVDHAKQLLGKLGYDAEESDFLVKAWDLLNGAAVTRQAVNVVRSRYVARRFDATQAKLYLDSLGLAGEARDRYLRIWDLEIAASVAVLSEAQIVKAHKDQLINGPEAFARLQQRGYSDGDAKILLGVAPTAPVPA